MPKRINKEIPAEPEQRNSPNGDSYIRLADLFHEVFGELIGQPPNVFKSKPIACRLMQPEASNHELYLTPENKVLII